MYMYGRQLMTSQVLFVSGFLGLLLGGLLGNFLYLPLSGIIFACTGLLINLDISLVLLNMLVQHCRYYCYLELQHWI